MKILDTEFRKELYKNLVDAGYDKQEAQKIVGKKYYEALKGSLTNMFTLIVQNLEKDEIEPLDEALVKDVNNDIAELQKMKEFIS